MLGDTDVETVLTRAGRCVGVRARDGREFAAQEAVIAAIHPHHLGRLVQGVDPVIAADAAATEISPNACITVHAALREPLRTMRGEAVRSVMLELLPTRYELLRRSFDDLRYGQLVELSADWPRVAVRIRRLAGARGQAATLHAWDYVPYERADGRSWDETKAQYAQRMLTHMARFLPNLTTENLIAWHCDSPLDMERTSSSFVRGDLHGIAMPSYQLGAHRPTPELGQFVVPGTGRAVPGGTVPAPRRRRVRRRTGHRAAAVRGPEDRFREDPAACR